VSDHPADADPDAHPRAIAAAALRRLGHALVRHEADDDLLLRVAAAADRVSEDVTRAPRRQRDIGVLKRRMFDREVADGERVVHFDECFVSGPWNPLGIAMEVRRDGQAAVATVTLGAAFEGAPGRSHGGIVAAIFDDVLGYLLSLHHVPGFTGELAVRYLAPTPLERPLTFRAELLEREGRKLRTRADARDGGELIATATATFVAVDPARFRT
jgi:acyl-coenzyme A thioesterase PaaI-like protein